jgi:hypothetical protein
MVFHILPGLLVQATKFVIKEAVDAPSCDKCGKEKLKMWSGVTLVFLCEDCENGQEVKTALRVLKIATMGVRSYFLIHIHGVVLTVYFSQLHN